MRHYATLDVLRGVAAIAVMMWHSNGHVLAPDGGYLAVDIFFGLSGFVIALNYEQRLRNGMSVWRFLVLRIARLWPMILVGSLPVVIISGKWWGTLFLIPEFGDTEVLFPANSPLWSLLMEMVAYFAFSLVGPRLSISQLAIIVLTAAFSLLALSAADYAMLSEFGAFQSTLLGGLARVAFSFSCGVLFFRLRQKAGMPASSSRAAWLIPMALIGTMYAVSIPGNYEGLFAIVFVLPFILWVATKWEVPGTKVANILAAISFPLYCIHMPAFSIAGAYGVPLIATWPILLVVSLLLDRCLDQPFRLWVRRYTQAKLPQTSANPEMSLLSRSPETSVRSEEARCGINA